MGNEPVPLCYQPLAQALPGRMCFEFSVQLGLVAQGVDASLDLGVAEDDFRNILAEILQLDHHPTVRTTGREP